MNAPYAKRDLPTQQPQTTLSNRPTIEHRGTTVDKASELLRTYAHTRNQKSIDVAATVVRNDPAVADLANGKGGSLNPSR